MSRARNHARPITPPTALARFCAAWIILVAISPYTLARPVWRARDIIGASRTRSSTPRNDDFEAWAVQGVALSIEPTAPMAQSIAAMSTAHLFSPDQAAPADHPIVAPDAPRPMVRGATVTILRV
jgi:hypothetical protein